MSAAVLFLVVLAAPEPIGDVAERVLQDGGYQSQLPNIGEAETATADGALRRNDRGRTFQIEGADAVLSVASVLWWILLGVVVVVLFTWLAREVARPRTAREALWSAPAEGARAPEVLPDPDALAAAGRHADAVHVLLLLLFQRMRRAAKAPSWTSREVSSSG